MADAPPGGLYPAPDRRAIVVGGSRLEVVGDPFGPAGTSSIELPSGETWTVDHLDPWRLVHLDVDGRDPARSPLLIAAFGGDGALGVAEGADGQPAGQASIGYEAESAGRLVLLADLADDPFASSMARITAVLELVGQVDDTPGGDLVIPLLDRLVSLAEALAEDLDDLDLPQLDPKRDGALLDAFTSMPLPRRWPMPNVRRLGRRLADLAATAESASDPLELMDVGQAARSAAWGSLDDHAPPAASSAEPTVHRRSPSLIDVTATRADSERWVRVLRRDGLALLAQAPLLRRGLLDHAELLVPPDTLDHELDVQIVHAEALTAVPSGSIAAIQRAVQAGKAAASAERSRSIHSAMRRWRECAHLWEAIGDHGRAELAGLHSTSSPRRRVSAGPLLADQLDPYSIPLDPDR